MMFNLIMHELTNDNYFDLENQQKYMSVSTFKNFIGTNALQGCEFRALAELNGEYERPITDALLVGSYVDVMLTGTEQEIADFQTEHPEMYSSRGATKGELKSTYQIAIKMVERAKRDEFFMRTLTGQKQVIMVGEIYGLPWKIKIDCLGDNFITDLKTTRSIRETYYNPSTGQRVSFVEHFDYILQMAVYREIVRQNTGRVLPVFLSVISKEQEPDIEVINIDAETLDYRLSEIRDQVESVKALLNGDVEPCRCGMCPYCRQKKILKAPISWQEIGGLLDEQV